MDIKIGIIAEGYTDQFVLRNILYAFDFDKKHIRFLRPELSEDESDKNESEAREFGSWTNVKNDCETKEPFIGFLSNQIAGEKFIIIQLDTDTCSQYGVQELFNPKTVEDFGIIRQRVIDKINEWLENKYKEQLFYAICIRQMDSWVLTLYANTKDKDTGFISLPKNQVSSLEAYKTVKSYRKIRIRYEILSEGFTNSKKFKKALEYNQSLKDFVESVKTKLEELEKKED
jgi:hypothetical protein